MLTNNTEALKNGDFICRNTRFCLMQNVGTHHRMFGGDLMEELDSACAVLAAEICDTPWVVTKIMNVEFTSPIVQNQIYKTYIKIKKIGTTSLILMAEIRKHSVHTEKETIAVKAEAVFVRINEEGEAIKISEQVRSKFGF